MTLEELNGKYGLSGALKFGPGPGGLTVATVRAAEGTATIALYGGHVLGFEPKGEQPVLWLSPRARFAAGTPIRGGVPICWPWFSTHPSDPSKPFHGFARISDWTVLASGRDDGGRVWLRLGLSETPATRAHWPHRFGLRYTVMVGRELGLELAVCNPAKAPYTYTAALHTYFAVSNVEAVSVAGLDGAEYFDKTEAQARKRQQGPVTIRGEVDRLYVQTESECVIDDPGWQRRIRVAKWGSRTSVVWNPGAKRAVELTDIGEDVYRDMLCVETVNAAEDVVTVKPGEGPRLAARISVERG